MNFYHYLFFICLCGILIFLEYKWQLLSLPYNNTRIIQRIVAFSVALFCLLLAILFYFYFSNAKAPIKYPLTDYIGNYSPYIQQFDAFKKGQIHIDVTPAKKLLELQNPYDPDARNGIYYLWDRALYNGHYYSYFGIAPIITIYYPYYYLTNQLPGDSFVVAIYLMITSFFLPLSIFSWIGNFTKRIPISILSIGAIAATLGTNVFLAARGVAHFYYIAVLAGMAFLSLFSFFLLRAIIATGLRRYLYYTLSGVSYGLIFLSRPNIAILTAFIIIPFLWFFVIKRQDEKRSVVKVIAELLTLGLPVLTTLIFTLWFNNVRFSSPFDFGTNYQLTVSDISQNKLRLIDFFYAVYHYFLQIFTISDKYPYISLSYISLLVYNRYVYIDANLGLFATPLMFGLLLTPIVIFGKNYQLRQKLLLASSLAGILIVAWLNFCIGGVIFRYTCDLTLIAALTALVTLFTIYEKLTPISNRAKYLTLFCFLVFLTYSLLVSIQIALIDNGNLSVINEDILNFIQKLIPFTF